MQVHRPMKPLQTQKKLKQRLFWHVNNEKAEVACDVTRFELLRLQNCDNIEQILMSNCQKVVIGPT